jgi:hypothetical protein
MMRGIYMTVASIIPTGMYGMAKWHGRIEGRVDAVAERGAQPITVRFCRDSKEISLIKLDFLDKGNRNQRVKFLAWGITWRCGEVAV